MKCSLVLEGGSMRASFSAGIIQGLIENDIVFPEIFAVSTGAAVAANYVSQQADRNLAQFVMDAQNKKRGGFKSFLLGKGFLNTQFIYQKTPYYGTLFDYDTFFNSTQEIHVGALDFESGSMTYFRKSEMVSQVDVNRKLQASASIPFLCPKTLVNKRAYLDGGLIDAIPIEKAIDCGFDKHVIILTRPRGYQKGKMEHKFLLESYYKRHPHILNIFENRASHYNHLRELVFELERDHKAFVFIVDEKHVVSNSERNQEKLMLSYLSGYRQLNERKQALLDFLQK